MGKNTGLESEERNVNIIYAPTDSVTPGDLTSGLSSPVNWGTGQYLRGRVFLEGGGTHKRDALQSALPDGSLAETSHLG